MDGVGVAFGRLRRTAFLTKGEPTFSKSFEHKDTPASLSGQVCSWRMILRQRPCISYKSGGTPILAQFVLKPLRERPQLICDIGMVLQHILLFANVRIQVIQGA